MPDPEDKDTELSQHTHTHNSQLCSLKACMSYDPRWRVDGGRDGDGQGYRVC